MNEIFTWLALSGIGLILLSSVISILSIKSGIKPGELLYNPGWAIHREIHKYIKPDRVFIVKLTATLGAFLFMSAILLLVFNALNR